MVNVESRDTTVLFIWDVPTRLKKYLESGLEQVENVTLIFPDEASEKEFINYAPDADIIVGWRPSDDLLEAAQKMKLYINPGAGVQHLLDQFRRVSKTRDIILVNGHGNSYFTAQHAVALLLALSNKIIPHDRWMREGLWRRGDSHAKSIPIRFRKIGLLGYGTVNNKVHRFLSGFNVEFHVLKRSWDKSLNTPTKIFKYTQNQLHEFLREIDTLIIAIPQTKETEALIAKQELALLSKEGLLVNMARGSVIVQKDLYEALSNQEIAGAAIDVWYEYRPEPDEQDRKYPYEYPFHELDNVVLSPHRGASPMDDLLRWNEVIENISRFARGKNEFLNMVDLERGY
ncbi:MAG: Glyoxylate reductase [Candidatus Thorarchaeota archaeon]|nr:MAG: Glyoxylate reductase [Candidatus Thorarchaeota archaeon]